MPDYKQDFLVMGSAEQRVWDLAFALCKERQHFLGKAYNTPCAMCRDDAGIKLLDETVAK